MNKPRRLAISYTRFSDPKQSEGDSENRQERMFRQFCQQHNLTPLTEVFADRGRSGYHDEHRKKGRLGQLVRLAKDGRFEPGTVIVVEAWDRLGRLRPDKMTNLIQELVQLDIGIGVCRLDDIFTEEDFGTHKWTTLAVFVQLAFQESKQKADRIGASWEKRRERARENGTPVTGRVPAWLELQHGQFVPIPERVATLKQIFRLSAEGFGRARIIRALMNDGVAPFPVPRRSTGPAKWTVPYINKILSDRRVLGEYQPRRTDDQPDGAAIQGYYPQVVSEQEYLMARGAQDGRRGRGGRRDRRHVNVFQSLIVHARDGEGFFLHNHGTADKPQLVLVNAAGQSGRKARTCTFPYLPFEQAVLGLLREVDPRDVLPAQHKGPSPADVLRAKLANVRHDMAALKQELGKGFSRAITDVLREREAEEVQVAGQLQDELARSVRPAERAWRELPSLTKLVEDQGDEARLRLRSVLRSVIAEIHLLIVRRGSYSLAAAQVFFTGGNRRDYLITSQSAGYHRPGGWWARSLATIAKADDLDLRKPEHARQLEKILLAVPLP
jgi:DNA invertase Pin-like site-specific DNA recombinase